MDHLYSFFESSTFCAIDLDLVSKTRADVFVAVAPRQGSNVMIFVVTGFFGFVQFPGASRLIPD